jgi:hypothetical protein
MMRPDITHVTWAIHNGIMKARCSSVRSNTTSVRGPSGGAPSRGQSFLLNQNVLVHLITGAGKSTCSKRLAGRIGAMRFSVDEWMSKLFWVDRPDPLYAEWSLERVRRCEEQSWERC